MSIEKNKEIRNYFIELPRVLTFIRITFSVGRDLSKSLI